MIHHKASVCVYCGARFGDKPAFRKAAAALGAAFADNSWRLVYGAGDVGMMGAVANAAQRAGAPTLGVVPSHLMHREVRKHDLTTLIVTENMHERKKVMFMNSDAVVVMPGGAGSLDEFFEVLTWRQLGLHQKPILLLNIEGFWDPLIGLLDHVIDQGFAEDTLRGFVTVVTDVDQAITALRDALS
ncbi:TIGR00730 family Rossman fold protein [Aliiroseovarius sediminis]|uniref:LOG family protein n=1 Tax=Aliiroseovarius sediminis TaxID=2925839 RepID=UPI001F5A6E4A|nr:TIGR00730 family Rossman fold protein [Aliiroseovarius sediminis]MCI2393371.1 TIGR00730 family Rossman fold protein [Aliiroseovarius sediminis]